jgi:hypothetical protein
VTERLEDVGGPGHRHPAPGPTGTTGVRDDGTDPGDDFYAGRELSLFIPESMARGIDRRRNTWTQIDTWALWLTAAHLMVLVVIVGRGSLYLDDLRAQAYALNQPFLQFIVGSNGTHFAPGPRILDWVQSRVFPLQHGPAVIITLVVRLLLAIGFWRLLRRVFGPRPGILVPFAMLLFTPALIPATTWYRQSITVVACTVAIVWALDAMLRWILYRRRADLFAVVAATVVAVCFYEKGAAIPVILGGVAVALFMRRPGGHFSTGLERPVRAALTAVMASGIVVVIFLVIYRSGPYDQGAGTTPTPMDVLHLTWDTSTRTVIPLLFGGPYTWKYLTPYAGMATISNTALIFCLVLVGVGFAIALRRGAERAVRGLLVLLLWSLVSVGIVAYGRFDSFQLLLAEAQRLWADLIPGFLLAGTMSVLPWAVGVCRSGSAVPGFANSAPSPEMVEGRPATRAEGRAQLRAPRPEGAPVELTVPGIAAVLVMLIVLGGSAWSSWTYASNWWDNPTGAWIANARASLKNAEPYPRTLATPLPEAVMPSWVSTQLPTSAPLLLLMRPDIRFHDGDGDAKVMNAAGMRAPYIPSVLAQTKKVDLCLQAIPPGSGEPTEVALNKTALYVPGNQVEVGILLAESTKVEVKVKTPQGQVLTPQQFSDVELPQGPHTVRFPVPFGQSVESVEVSAGNQQPACVTYARIWAPLS